MSSYSLAKARESRPPPGGVLAEPVTNAGGADLRHVRGLGAVEGRHQRAAPRLLQSQPDTAVDIPIGPENSIEPGGPDFGQPTHFLTGRQYGMFAITVPKDFGNKKLTWTIVANGHKTSVQFWLNPQYWIDYYKNLANGNEPPRIKFGPTGTEYIGPPKEKTVATLSATVGQPLDLTAWAADQPPTITFESGAEPPAAPLPPAARQPEARQ